MWLMSLPLSLSNLCADLVSYERTGREGECLLCVCNTFVHFDVHIASVASKPQFMIRLMHLRVD